MTDLTKLTVTETASILDAMAAIDDGASAIALVVDEQQNLLGVVTDGDIRRALLGGAALDATIADHMTKDYVSVGVQESRNQVIDLMRARGIHQVPVTERGRVIGLHTLDQLIGNVARPNFAVLMAGGRGTRLQPITDAIPKPMLPVAGRPILERLVLHLVGWGIRSIYISINYLGEQIRGHFGDGSEFGCDIDYLEEDEPLGTGGPLSLLPPTEHPVIVMNGDLITQVDIGALLATHNHGEFSATMAVRPHLIELPFGVVEADGSTMTAIAEKPHIEHLVNAGMYVLDPEVIAIIPKDTAVPITDIFTTQLSNGGRVGVHTVEDDWIDVGRPSELARAKGLI